MLIVRRHEDNLRSRSVVEHPARHLEAGEPRHLHVEKDEIRVQALDRRERLDAVTRLTNHLDPAHLSEQVPELVARELLVVHEYGPQVHSRSEWV